MLSAVMRPRLLLPLILVVAALAAAGCGGTKLAVAKSDPLYEGAKIFNQRCGGCHTYDSASTEGSSVKVNSREYKDGPNFNVRKEQYPDVLYAIENGGFSSGPMPQNVVVGEQAKVVACFVAAFSGKDAKQTPSPGGATSTPKSGDCRPQLAQK